MLTSCHLHGSITSGAIFTAAARTYALYRKWREGRAKKEGKMNSLDRIMEFVLAAVFLCVGLMKIFGYERRVDANGSGKVTGLLGFPYGCTIAVGIFEILAAVALMMPVTPISPAILAPLAVVGLALTSLAAWVCRARRQQPADPAVVMFLLTLFVMVGIWY
jgi:uncharacterized membrane protein YphA (DoxX/SURF4 family)